MPRDLLEDVRQPRDLLADVEAPQEPVDFSASEMVKNIPSSAMEFGKNIVTPFIHPVDTAKSVGSLAHGLIGKGSQALEQGVANALPDEQFPSDFVYAKDYGYGKGQPGWGTRYPETEAADQMGKFISDRYGSVDAFKRTAQEDPVGLLADLSMVLTAGGTAAAQAPGRIGKIGKVVQTAGKATEPLNIAKGAAKFGASKLTSKATPAAMYESSAKFSTTLTKEKRLGMAETALKHEIMPTAAGLDKLGKLTNKFDTEITGLIDDATKAGKTIPRGAVFKHLNKLRKDLGGVKVDAPSDLKQINRVAKTIDTHLKKLGKQELTPNELQVLKQDAYAKVSFDKSQLKSSVGTEAARKGVARAAKEAIEGMADVKDLNRELGALLELKKPLSRSAARIENRDIVGIGTPIKIAAGQAAGGTQGAVAATGLSILEHPKIKAQLAIKLKKIQNAGELNLIDHNLLPTLVHYGLLQAGRSQEESPP